ALNNRLDRADRYVTIARKIGMRYLVRIPKKYKLLFCKNCYRFLLPGVTSRVRTNRGKLVIYCKHCKSYRRIPLGDKSGKS
ncbi:MAG TPA: ribonuclease P, partial [Thermoplasmatales archaeon]|nr:ribonuclease P [Thermoplasmatales archaeon]